MTSDGAEIRIFRAGDEKELIDGLNASRRTRVSLEDWNWSYPVTAGDRPIVVGVADGRVVAHAGGVVTAFRVGGRTVPALAVADEFVQLSAGGEEEKQRLSSNLLERLLAEFGGEEMYPFVYRLTGHGENVGGTGIELPPVDVLSRRSTVRSTLRRLAYRAEPARDWEPRLDELWRRVGASYPFAAARDAETALSRHAGHPTGRRYRFLVFPRFSGRAVAFAVFEPDGTRCRWVDLVWDHDEPGALDLLCHVSQRLARQLGAEEETVVLGGDAAGRSRLEASGFRAEGVLEDRSLTVFSWPQGMGCDDIEGPCYITQTDLDPLRRAG